MEATVGAPGKTFGMGDKEEARIGGAGLVQQSFENGVGGGFVKVAGGLIGEDKFGAW